MCFQSEHLLHDICQITTLAVPYSNKPTVHTANNITIAHWLLTSDKYFTLILHTGVQYSNLQQKYRVQKYTLINRIAFYLKRKVKPIIQTSGIITQFGLIV